jgi:hypothetical protein
MGFQNDPRNRRIPQTGASSVVPQKGNREFAKAEPVQSREELRRAKAQDVYQPVPVALPDHLYIPQGEQSIDLSRIVTVPNGGSETLLMSYTNKIGAIAVFTRYSLLINASPATPVTFFFSFVPRLNGHRIFPEHGDPNLNFAIRPFPNSDLGENFLRHGYIEVQPLQTIEWYGVNTSAVNPVSMGVRMIGYRRTRTSQEPTRFGG